MKTATAFRLPHIVKNMEGEILADWITLQKASLNNRYDLLSEAGLAEQSKHFLRVFQQALQEGAQSDIEGRAWQEVRQILEELSQSRTEQGFDFMETATFIFSLKQPLFAKLQEALGTDTEAFKKELWVATEILDKLGLYTADVYQKVREKIIKRQQDELLELSTPVIKLWEGILALPMIGTLDSYRTQIVMETLLQKIIENDCLVAIIDITGVPNVDTLVAQHLLKTVTAARLMGTECIISGIRPQIAQTIVHLGVNLQGVITKATLAEAFKIALKVTGQKGSVEAYARISNEPTP